MKWVSGILSDVQGRMFQMITIKVNGAVAGTVAVAGAAVNGGNSLS